MLRLVAVSLVLGLAYGSPVNPSLQWDTDCGYSIYNDTDHTMASQVVGGTEARPGEFPWQIEFLNTKKGTLCGGFLIANEWALSAAHCINNANGDKATDYLISVGLHDRRTADNGAVEIIPLGGIVHELYDDVEILNDIILVQLPSGSIPTPYNDIIRPVCRPTGNSDFAGSVGTISGWGTTSSGGSISNLLLWANLDIISNTQCQAQYEGYETIFDTTLCANRAGKDSCQGDSGGPFTVYNSATGRNEAAGIVSWGYGCADPNFSGIYTRITDFLTWIDSHMNAYQHKSLNGFHRG